MLTSRRVCGLDGQLLYYEGLIQDISERKQAEEALKRSEEKYRDIFDKTMEGIYRTTPAGHFDIINPAFARICGYASPEEMVEKVTDIANQLYANPEDRFRFQKLIVAEGEVKGFEVQFKHPTKGLVWVSINSKALRDEQGNIKHYDGTMEDITDRKRAEEELHVLSSRQEALLAAVPEIIMEVDNNKVYTWANSVGFEFFGEDVIGKEADFYFEGEQETYDKVNPLFNGAEDIIYVESWQRRRDGEKRLLAWWCRVLKDKNSNVTGALSSARDITKAKRTEEMLQESEERFRALFENAPLGYQALDSEGCFIEVNQTWLDQLGYSREEVAGCWFGNFLAPEYVEAFKQRFPIFKASGEIHTGFEMLHKNGYRRFIEFEGRIGYDTKKNFKQTHCILLDVTQRKQAEKNLQESEEKFRTIFNKASDGILIADATTKKFVQGNNTICSMLGYPQEEIISLGIHDIHPPDDLSHVLDEFEKQAKREKVLAEGLPLLRKDGSIFYADISSTPLTIEGRLYLVGIFRDITERKQAEEQLRHTLDSLRKSFGTIIQVMVSAVEVRDPYTAGHQIRSAHLARAIATEMGLSQDIIEAIRMAGPIHDIGKLSIPAEILSKPTKLTEIEFSLIKEHARTGYEMLKDVESPWPLAEIVYQHHERMDGSGYPRNLRGDEILIEARILSVADIVEAMASHRPYRPGLGIEVALNEIEKNRGTLYDITVADACLRLFREKGFQFEEPRF